MIGPGNFVNSGLPKVAFDRYELIRPLGEGGAGTVYLALDRETGGQVALKMLSRMTPVSVLRFKREFRALANIHHRNLVKLYELEYADGGWFLTMEWVDGEPLLAGLDESVDDSLAASHAREQVIFQRFFQLAEGVQAIHHAGMVHCDLKPSNVILERGGRVVVLDFGLVRELSESASDTVDGTTSGTPCPSGKRA
jgi:eukaryotic-like serine/threonine-protein kinase